MVWRCCEVFCRVSKKITDSNTTYLLTHYQWSIPKNTKTSNCFDTNLCLFNPIFNPTIICMSVIKTQICTRVRELCDCIVQRTTAMATKQRQRQHHMSVSCPSCAGARASFRTVRCCLMTTTHDCASNKPSCAKEVIPVTSGNISWFLNLGLYGSSLVQDLSCTS